MTTDITTNTMPAPTAAIWIDPSRMSGEPCLTGTRIPCETIARYVAHEGMERTQQAYELGHGHRRAILVACSWWTLNITPDTEDDERLVRYWRTWARNAWKDLWHDTQAATDAISDPPQVPARP